MRPTPPLQLIGVICDNDFLYEQLEESLKPIRTINVFEPILNAIDEIFHFDNSFKPLVLQEHHIRHFFTKLNAGVVPIQRFVGKQVNSQQEVYDYYFNTILPKAFEEDWVLNRFLDDISDLDTGVYFISNFLPYAKSLKINYPTFYSVNVYEDDSKYEPDVDYNLKAKTKTKLKQLLIEMTHKSKGETYERTK